MPGLVPNLEQRLTHSHKMDILWSGERIHQLSNVATQQEAIFHVLARFLLVTSHNDFYSSNSQRGLCNKKPVKIWLPW